MENHWQGKDKSEDKGDLALDEERLQGRGIVEFAVPFRNPRLLFQAVSLICGRIAFLHFPIDADLQIAQIGLARQGALDERKKLFRDVPGYSHADNYRDDDNDQPLAQLYQVLHEGQYLFISHGPFASGYSLFRPRTGRGEKCGTLP